MDGVGATYETLRGRPFAAFCHHLENVRTCAPFGINYVVNSQTLPDMDAATTLAAEFGATEFLLLPEQPVRANGGIDNQSKRALQRWVTQYRGSVPLVVSERGSEGLPICNPLQRETGLRSYAHIDALGILKLCSFDSTGVAIEDTGIMKALNRLQTLQTEEAP
jgi:hypothetical protein